jgi:hypothetical protein
MITGTCVAAGGAAVEDQRIPTASGGVDGARPVLASSLSDPSDAPPGATNRGRAWPPRRNPKAPRPETIAALVGAHYAAVLGLADGVEPA